MPYLIFSLILAIGVVVILHLIANRRKKNLLLRLKSSWGNSIERYRDYFDISLYARLSGVEDKSKLINDVDLNLVYAKIDRCHTSIGQQVLYRLFTGSFEKSSFDERMLRVHAFSNHEQLRLSVQAILAGQRLSYKLPRLFLTAPKTFVIPWFYRLLAIAPIVLMIISAYWNVVYFAVAISVAVNMFIHYRNKKNIQAFLDPILEMISLTRCCRQLMKVAEGFKNTEVEKATEKLGALEKYNFILSSDSGQVDDLSAIFWVIIEYVKAIFLVEVLALENCSQLIARLGPSVQSLYEYAGQLDASISVASYRASLKQFAEPEFIFNGNAAALDIIGATHPLMKACVPNDIHAASSGMVITGSNMSGKTSFIKTIALNVILAQAIGTVPARKYKGSIFQLCTSVKTEDSLTEGRSYYLTEVIAVKNLIEALKDNTACHLFVIDELFKGTNTAERIAASRAVLLHLQKPNSIVLVSTHDLELAYELRDRFALFHFTDAIEGNDLVFDHTIKAGPLLSRNAIRLMSAVQFPEEVVKEAERFIEKNKT